MTLGLMKIGNKYSVWTHGSTHFPFFAVVVNPKATEYIGLQFKASRSSLPNSKNNKDSSNSKIWTKAVSRTLKCKWLDLTKIWLWCKTNKTQWATTKWINEYSTMSNKTKVARYNFNSNSTISITNSSKYLVLQEVLKDLDKTWVRII